MTVWAFVFARWTIARFYAANYRRTASAPENSSMKRFYTIGQRRGLGIDLNRAVFVKEIFPEENKVILSNLKALKKTEMTLKDWNITNPDALLCKDDVIVKIRYRKQANRCTVTLQADNTLHVQLHEPLTAIATGQAAAFYREDVVLGGGIIQ